MKALRIPILLTILPLFLLECSTDKDAEIDKECHIDISIYDFTFGINYNDPGKYLIPGEQSNLNDIYKQEIQEAVGDPVDTIDYILELCHWINQHFEFEDAGGAMMGVKTAEELWEIKKFYGCHSLSLIISSTFREFGIPAVMIETAGVQWAYEYKNRTT